MRLLVLATAIGLPWAASAAQITAGSVPAGSAVNTITFGGLANGDIPGTPGADFLVRNGVTFSSFTTFPSTVTKYDANSAALGPDAPNAPIISFISGLTFHTDTPTIGVSFDFERLTNPNDTVLLFRIPGQSIAGQAGTGYTDGVSDEYVNNSNTAFLKQGYGRIDTNSYVSTTPFTDFGIVARGAGEEETTFAISSLSLFSAPTEVPEPASLALVAIGILGLAAYRRRRVSTPEVQSQHLSPKR